jgi:mono/diheme cytochrome c family protein
MSVTRLRTLAGLLAVAMLLPNAIGARELLGSDDAIVNTGHTLFQRYCSSCHGVDGQGALVEGTTTSIRAPDLTGIAERNGGTLAFWALYEVISGSELLPAHGREMPIWGEQLRETLPMDGDDASSVVRGRILAIMAYLATIQK